MFEKRKDAYSRLQILQLQKVLLLMLMKVWMGENKRPNHKSMWQRYGVLELNLNNGVK